MNTNCLHCDINLNFDGYRHIASLTSMSYNMVIEVYVFGFICGAFDMNENVRRLILGNFIHRTESSVYFNLSVIILLSV